MGFANPTKAVVVLSGAHTIGSSQATARGGPPRAHSGTCSRGLGAMTEADEGKVNGARHTFDGRYYSEVSGLSRTQAGHRITAPGAMGLAS
jgi:hypothetical protein